VLAILRPKVAAQEAFGVLDCPALKLHERDEPELAAADELELGLHVALEGIQRHPERRSCLLATERDARDIAEFDVHGNF
jgi:hypothetical protein